MFCLEHRARPRGPTLSASPAERRVLVVECSRSSTPASYPCVVPDRWSAWAARLAVALGVEPVPVIVDILLATGVVLTPGRAGAFLVDLSPHGPIRSALSDPIPSPAYAEELASMIDTAAGTGGAIVDALELVQRNRDAYSSQTFGLE